MKTIITFSEIRKFVQCPRKHHYAYTKLLRPALVSPALNKGRLFHEGAAEWLRTSDLDAALQMVNTKCAEYIEEIEDQGIIVTYERSEMMELDRNVVRAMLTGATDKFKDDMPKVTAVETEFSFEFNGITIAGKIDFVGTDAHGQPFIGEWKTTSDGVETFKNKLLLDWQTIFYAWAWEKFTGQRIDTALFFLVRVSSSKPTATENTAQYHKRLRDMGLQFAKIVPKDIGAEHPRQPETWKQYKERILERYTDDEMFGMEIVGIDRELVIEHEKQLPIIIAGILADHSYHSYDMMTCSMCSYKSLCMGMTDVEFVEKEKKHSELK